MDLGVAELGAGEVAEQLLDLRAEVLDGVLLNAQSAADPVGEADRPAESHVDPARVERLEHAELFGHDERLVIGQHHAAGADPDPGGRSGYCSSQDSRG